MKNNRSKLKEFPVIDLFAGPGGLGEGFSSFTNAPKSPGFSVRLSIEMDPIANQTLLLRKFFRAFQTPPREYWEYLAGRITKQELYARYPSEHRSASNEVWQAELGVEDQATVTRRIKSALNDSESWALIGGPPCQAYSLVGRSRMQSKTNPDFEADHRHFLYKEYLRIVAIHRPPVFVMENVKGLISATHSGEKIFNQILTDLRQPGKALAIHGRAGLQYQLYSIAIQDEHRIHSHSNYLPIPESLVVKSEDYGIPQARHRVFILGVREDVCATPSVLIESDRVTVADVIRDLPRIRSTLSRTIDSFENWRDVIGEVTAQPWYRRPSGDEQYRASVTARVELGRIAEHPMDSGVPWRRWSSRPKMLSNWYRASCEGLSNHEARGHMAGDLHRYFFASCFSLANNRSPLLDDFPPELLPNHRNTEQGIAGSMFADRFRVQLSDRPSTTVTSHISKDGHYFIHPDPSQCRSLTVREAARLQTFPDNYHFEGPRTAQYHQVGNAVPPLLAKQIAAIVHGVLSNRR